MSVTNTDGMGARIEKLLDDVQDAAGPVTWPRVEALVTALVEMYGVGLDRVLGIARAAAGDPRSLEESLARDELVASLLALHELHTVPLDPRVQQVLDGPPPRPDTALIPASSLVRGSRP
jgi:hypothetical protein